ncbi:hypothetical protein ACFQV4_28590 [Streptomyces thermocarboxydus]
MTATTEHTVRVPARAPPPPPAPAAPPGAAGAGAAGVLMAPSSCC